MWGKAAAVAVLAAVVIAEAGCTQDVSGDMASSICTPSGRGVAVVSLTSLRAEFSAHTIISVTVDLRKTSGKVIHGVVLNMPPGTIVQPGDTFSTVRRLPVQYVTSCKVTAVTSKV